MFTTIGPSIQANGTPMAAKTTPPMAPTPNDIAIGATPLRVSGG
jgi:hypothetical protein